MSINNTFTWDWETTENEAPTIPVPNGIFHVNTSIALTQKDDKTFLVTTQGTPDSSMTLDDCKSAAEKLDKTFKGGDQYSNPNEPKGCFQFGGTDAYFNNAGAQTCNYNNGQGQCIQKPPQLQCRKQEKCDFYNWVVDKNGSDNQKCGGEHKGGSKCAGRCCAEQNAFCRRQMVADMSYYFRCMRDRGCEDDFTCAPDDGTRTFSDLNVGSINYDVEANNDERECYSYYHGGNQCGDECCQHQVTYCKRTNDDIGLHGFFECTGDRSCFWQAMEDVHGKKTCPQPSGTEWVGEGGCNQTAKKEGDLEAAACNWEGRFRIEPTWTDDAYKCGGKYQGGAACNEKCCKGQHEHCHDSQITGTKHGYFECMEQRNCTSYKSCDRDGEQKDYGWEIRDKLLNYEINKDIEDTWCGKSFQGGETCKAACCITQWDYCRNKAGIIDVHKVYDCMDDRDCMSLATEKFTKNDAGEESCNHGNLNFYIDTNWTDINYYCGGTRQGGSACKYSCVRKQVDHCQKACAADTNPDACLTRCAKSRKIHGDLRCDDYTFDVKPTDEHVCGEENKGGSACEEKCCEKQWDYCRNKASIGEVPTLFDCMEDRGCFDYATEKINGPIETFMEDGEQKEERRQCAVADKFKFTVNPNADAKYKCGGTHQGNEQCKNKCCTTVAEHSDGGCGMLDRPYMKKRGCETDKPKNDPEQPDWGFLYDGHTWPNKCVPGAHDYSPEDTTSKVADVNKCNAVGDCANHEATSMHAGTYCSRKRGSAAGSQKYCVEKEEDFMDTWWAPIDITCFKGQQWNNVMGMGGDCTSDDQCCSGYCEISDEKSESCFGECHPDGKDCRGAVTSTKCTARCPAKHGEKCGTETVVTGSKCTARCPYNKDDDLTTTYQHATGTTCTAWCPYNKDDDLTTTYEEPYESCTQRCPKSEGDLYAHDWLGKWYCAYKYCWNDGVACGAVWGDCVKATTKYTTKNHKCGWKYCWGNGRGVEGAACGTVGDNCVERKTNYETRHNKCGWKYCWGNGRGVEGAACGTVGDNCVATTAITEERDRTCGGLNQFCWGNGRGVDCAACGVVGDDCVETEPATYAKVGNPHINVNRRCENGHLKGKIGKCANSIYRR